MNWIVKYSRKVDKNLDNFPTVVIEQLFLLIEDIKTNGPVRGNWKNYGKLPQLGKDFHHCHIHKGKATYVCVWKVEDKKIKLVEVKYVGTHEKAPY